MSAKIVLSKIATINAENNVQNADDTRDFHFNGKNWKFLDSFTNDSKTLLEIIKLYGNAKLKVVEFLESEDGNQLMVLYKTNVYRKRKHWTDISIDTLFEVLFRGAMKCRGTDEEEGGSSADSRRILKTYVTTKLFEALERCHRIVAEPDLHVQLSLPLPAKFIPELCNYQKKTVLWLLTKERSPATFSPYFEKLEAKDNETVVYKHLYAKWIQNVYPPEIVLPPGGILAEEMGLGKTVEMLALILLNPRIDVSMNPRLDLIFRTALAKRRKEDAEVFCLCISKSQNKVIQCSKCFLWQHSKCVAKYNEDHDDEVNNPYMCPSCWQSVIGEYGILKSKGTFIVSPCTIKLQWLSEIRRHIRPSLRVFLYDGVVAGKWISPRQLAQYDVILTDYNILGREIYYTNENLSERSLRNKPRSIRVQTPILMVEWWRCVLDEAQMVESNTSNVASLVRMIPSINRWAVTGTPIQRSLNDLQPLLKFVGFDAVAADVNTWNHLVNDFLLQHENYTDENTLELVNVLQKCMWRTGKSQISHELQIPPQRQILHRIQFDNLEKLFYNEQHSDCKAKFMGNVRKYTSRMSTISPQIMKIILQPFLKIRQSCTMPVVVINASTSKATTTSQQKQFQFLQPQELHSYLKSSNEISCKSELRAMASSHNGLAALYYIQQKYDEAIKHYNAVLKLSKDYIYMNVSVDSLLQIHALHNLMEITIIQNDPNLKLAPMSLTQYELQYNSLEWKYLSTYSNTLSVVMTAYQAGMSKMYADVAEQLIESVSEALDKLKISETSLLLQKIHEECLPRFGISNVKLAEIQSTRSLLYIIDMWFTKLGNVLNSLKCEIDNLRYFTDNVKSRNQVSPDMWKNIMELVNSVYDCHLSTIRENQNVKNKDKQATKAKNKCKMCSIRDLINSFECLLFNKHIDEITNLTEGLENHSFEVFLCKLIFAYLKNKHAELELSKTMENNWMYLENCQTLCKRIIKLWIEIEYTIKAYDELNMCKMRIILTEDPDDKSIYKIFEHEIEQRILDQQNELQTAQTKFTVKLARLKYIKHLESDEEMGPCPICQLLEEDRYAVLECGHQICFQCLKSIQQYTKGANFKCSVCRHIQHNQNLYYVSRSKARKLENHIIKGNYSSKITYLVLLILKLQKQDNGAVSPNVLENEENCEKRNLKILVFSQWPPILQAISAALKENDITFRTQCTPKTLEDFKNSQLDITCLLMPFIKGSKGLNLVEATHVFLVEPILNPGEELQAIGRVHRFGQTKTTTVHRFIMDDSIEENIHNFITSPSSKASSTNGMENKWELDNVSLDDFENLFILKTKNDQ